MSKRGFPRADLQGMKAEACRLLPTTSTLTWPITSSSARARCAAIAVTPNVQPDEAGVLG